MGKSSSSSDHYYDQSSRKKIDSSRHYIGSSRHSGGTHITNYYPTQGTSDTKRNSNKLRRPRVDSYSTGTTPHFYPDAATVRPPSIPSTSRRPKAVTPLLARAEQKPSALRNKAARLHKM